ncbi:MAG: hypothetical protein ACKOB4_18940 [Acidobacteriota bacterium]
MLRPAPPERFAGRIVLIPAPSGLQYPGEMKLLARLANHELLIPPAKMLQDRDLLREWILTRVGIESDGLLIAPAPDDRARQQMIDETLAEVRQRRPRMAIEASPRPLSQWVSGEVEAALRLARMVNQRFGERPRILPFYSEAGNEPLRSAISLMIKAVGGIEVASGTTGNLPRGTPDLLLFVALPGTSDAGHERLIDGIRRTIGRDVRVALADLTTDAASQERLSATLRRERWLDRLASLAASQPEPSPPSTATRLAAPEETVARSLAHSTIFLTGMRSLRDNLEQLYRIDRTQVALLLSRYLKDYRDPRGPRTLSENPPRETEEMVRTRAEELFKEQFRRNIHATRLATGERAQYEIRLLQQLRVRIPAVASGRAAPEIVPSIHLAWLGNLSRSATSWYVTNDDLSPRLIKRWVDIPWFRFATGAERVRVTFISKRMSPESYRIVSRLSGATREIEISGVTDQARRDAISHLSRLGATGELVRDLDLTETPHTAVRGIIDDQRGAWSLRERLDLIAMLGNLRMNRYVLIAPGDASTFSAENLDALRRAADESFIELEIVSEPPPVHRSLNPEGAPFCLSPLRDLAEIGAKGGDEPLLLDLASSPYLMWPRLAAAAELAWNPSGYQPGKVSAALFPGLDAEVIDQFAKVFAEAGDCRKKIIQLGQAGQPFKQGLPTLQSIPLSGWRVLSLFRGELLRMSANGDDF